MKDHHIFKVFSKDGKTITTSHGWRESSEDIKRKILNWCEAMGIEEPDWSYCQGHTTLPKGGSKDQFHYHTWTFANEHDAFKALLVWGDESK